MKTRILTLFLILAGTFAFAQEPEYFFDAPNPGAYDGTNGSVCAFVKVDGVIESTPYILEVAAICEDDNGSVRGRGFVKTYGYGNTVTMMVYGNNGDKLNFKVYNHETNTLYNGVCLQSLTYEPNCELGSGHNVATLEFWIPLTCEFTNVNGNNWSNEVNWTNRIPKPCDDAIINGACVADGDATVEYSTLTILDGGQLNPNGLVLTASFEKNIAAYTPNTRDSYYFIGSPISYGEGESILNTTNLLSGNYDLYFFDPAGIDDPANEEPSTMEWQNYRIYLENLENEDWNEFVAPFGGYLYGNAVATTLKFTGTVNQVSEYSPTLDCNSNDENFPGFCLVGNPLPCNASVAKYQATTNIVGFYTLDENRDEVISIEDPIVAPCTALFAVTTYNKTGNRRRIKFTPTMSGTVNTRDITNLINIEVRNSEGLLDRAYVRFNEQENLQKFTMNADATHIYFREDGKDFAIVQGNERMSQLPLYFETKEYGEYTINVKLENMNCEYLHLIDNMTGADVDLNVTPSYTFNAHQGDYASRFRIMFEGTGVEENNTENFVIVEGNRFIIPEVENGSTLTIIDMMGRIVSSQTINGSFDQTMNLANGMYIVKLNGNSQKVIVR